MVEGGRIIVPAAYRKELGLEKGDIVVMEIQGDALIVRRARSALRRLQDRLRPLVESGGSVVDEFIADRRAEAVHE